jgi:very-short-patch-repair endonuclease
MLSKRHTFPIGNVPWNKGKKMSQEYRDICRKRQIGTKQTQETIKKRVESFIGEKHWIKKSGGHTQETKNKISRTKTGVSNFKKRGTHHSEETKEKIRQTKLSHPTRYWLGKKRDLETMRKLKEARSKIVLPTKDTRIEIKIQRYLNWAKIPFYKHYYIKEIEHGYQCDILIPSMNLIIECDGDYWHNYPQGRDIDKIRTAELIQRGFKVLRLWEREIKKMSLSAFKERLTLLEGSS